MFDTHTMTFNTYTIVIGLDTDAVNDKLIVIQWNARGGFLSFVVGIIHSEKLSFLICILD